MKPQPLNPLHIDVSGADIVAHASSDRPNVRHWTELGVFFLPSADGRCFLARAEGHSRIAGQTTRRRAVYVGTIARALEFFDDSELADAIRLQAEDWMDRNGARVAEAVDQLREQERSSRKGGLGYTGPTLLGAISWLYGDAQAGKAQRLADDFGVPRRTVAHALDQEQAGQTLTGWAKAFVSALQHFDRDSFVAAKGGA